MFLIADYLDRAQKAEHRAEAAMNDDAREVLRTLAEMWRRQANDRLRSLPTRLARQSVALAVHGE
jgi:hypothetical protein